MGGLIRSRRYLYAIEKIFAELRLPRELARLPLVESSFDYTAYSVVGAAGIWQFMRPTAKRYMRVDAALDERRDPIIASRAAAQYLRSAYRTLERWPLAVTSYNHGVAGVARAAREVGSVDLATIIRRFEGRGFGFASKNFFPSFLAAIEVDRNWRHYFPNLQFEEPWKFEEIRIGRAVQFSQLLRLSGVSSERLQELNRAFLPTVVSGRLPIPAGSVVKVPTGAGAQVLQGIPGSSRIQLAQILPPPPRERIVARRAVSKGRQTRAITRSKKGQVVQTKKLKSKTISPTKARTTVRVTRAIHVSS